MLWQPDLAEKYRLMGDEALGQAIAARRQELGESLLILGHHYQRDDVIRHADFTGDSLKLSQLSASESKRRGVKWIVFCGVHFMAETADVLNGGKVAVILPDVSAGCSMADMADAADAKCALEELQEVHKKAGTTRVVPITYVNSSAAVKALVGAWGGACCTSSNAERVMKWALAGGTQPLAKAERVQVVFLPDQHLGRNTAKRLGFTTDVDAKDGAAQCAVWNPRQRSGGMSASQMREAQVVLWAGHCSVHKLFRPEHVESVRARADGTLVLVHPECSQEVVDLADLVGSTEFIIKSVEGARRGTKFAVGTEFHLVERLSNAAQPRGVEVDALSDCNCMCTTMYRIDQPHLLWALDELAAGRVVNRVSVPPALRQGALKAIDRMMANAEPLPSGSSASAPLASSLD